MLSRPSFATVVATAPAPAARTKSQRPHRSQVVPWIPAGLGSGPGEEIALAECVSAVAI
jgi:hypothetical protein